MELAGDRASIRVAGAFAAATLLLLLLTNAGYGYFRDELYFLACGEHLAWGYVDFAPMVAGVAKLSRTLFGDSLHAIRFFPAVAAALTVFLTGLIARELGGRRYAVGLACLGVLAAPMLLALGGMLTMNAFEPVFWAGCVYVLLVTLRRGNPRLLVLCGALAGLGLENKHSTFFFLSALGFALLMTPERRLLASKWMWIAAAVALAIFLPNLIWQQQHGWPTLEDLNNVRRSGKNVKLGPVAFLGQQLLLMNPAGALVWIGGLGFLLFNAAGKGRRFIAWIYLALLAMMIALGGKNYYMAPAYPMLFAAGGVWWERLKLRWAKIALPAVLAASAIVFAPLTVPLLPVETFLRYQQALGFEPPKTEVGHAGPLPQYYGDRFGWPEMVETVAQVYHALPPAERANTAILAGNYGEAGAVDFFGPRHGLPEAISGHQNYYLWGPRGYTGETLILLQYSRGTAERACSQIEDGPELNHPYAMAEEHYRILVCRGLKQPLEELWPRLKHWN